MSSDVVVSLQDLHKSFGANHVLRGIDLEVTRGEVVCIIGPSGSGKSTLLRCVNMLETPSSGTITVLGRELTDIDCDIDEARSKIGMVFQSYNLFPHMSVMENICLAPVRVLGRKANDTKAQALALLEQFGLADKAKSYPDQLSGGQQQRVAIVRALTIEPEVLLLDEITSALDPELVGEVLDAVRNLRNTGMTVVLATHEMSFAREISDTVCMLDGGVIIEKGSPESMFTNATNPRTRQFLSRVSSR